MRRTSGLNRQWAALWSIGMLLVFLAPACDEPIQPKPAKLQNLTPETELAVQGDSLPILFYKFPMAWLGSDPDGVVDHYRYRWLCPPTVANCPVDSNWTQKRQGKINH
jgi:hypothetical protein